MRADTSKDCKYQSPRGSQSEHDGRRETRSTVARGIRLVVAFLGVVLALPMLLITSLVVAALQIEELHD